MLNRRKRVIVHCNLSQTLNRIREALGRSVELVVAADVATLEAAVRLYQHVAGLLIEKRPSVDLPVAALHLASDLLPATPRVVLVDYEATGGVHAAMGSGLVTHLVLIPFNSDELTSLLGVEAPQNVLPTRFRSYPPLTGGIRANSSPSANE